MKTRQLKKLFKRSKGKVKLIHTVDDSVTGVFVDNFLIGSMRLIEELETIGDEEFIKGDCVLEQSTALETTEAVQIVKAHMQMIYMHHCDPRSPLDITCPNGSRVIDKSKKKGRILEFTLPGFGE